jgi:hypothetical protein
VRFVAALAVAMLISASAGAYEIKHTSGGEMVRWRSRSAELVAQKSGDPARDQQLLEALEGAALAWRSGAGLALAVSAGGESDAAGRIGVRFALGAWADDPVRLATTKLSFDGSSGQIVAAEIVVNDRDYAWSDRMVGDLDAWDLQNVLTHEIGHAIGLEHSELETATMFAHTPRDDLGKRDLDADDISAVAVLYAEPPALQSGCRVSGRAPGSAAYGVGLLAALFLRRPRSRRGSRKRTVS